MWSLPLLGCHRQLSAPPTHHDPERGRHLGQGVGIVRGDGWDPRTPQQGEEPWRIDRVEVHTQVPGRVVPVGQGTHARWPTDLGLQVQYAKPIKHVLFTA